MAAAATAIGVAATPAEKRKLVLARFYVERMLPQTLALAAALTHDSAAVMALQPDDL